MELEKFRFITFASEAEAIQREIKATNDANFNDGVTVKYANIIKKFDEDLWLIPVLLDFEFLFSSTELDGSIWLTETQIYGEII